MKLLALDTATEACSVALNLDGDVVEHFEVIPRRHSRELLPMVEALLGSAGVSIRDMDALAFGAGPGAFTGLRVATAMIQGLAYAVDLPVIPISTLAALAQQGLREQGSRYVLSAIDARMGEVYWGAYEEQGGLMQPMQSESVLPPEQAVAPEVDQSWFGMGTGWAFREQIAVKVQDCTVETYPHAADIVRLAVRNFEQGQVLPAEKAMPVYLRDKVALKKSER